MLHAKYFLCMCVCGGGVHQTSLSESVCDSLGLSNDITCSFFSVIYRCGGISCSNPGSVITPASESWC